MSENSKAQTSVTELVLLTGGLIGSGAIGWSLARAYKIDYKEMMMYALSFTGGMGILSAVLFYKSRKFSGSQRKSATSEKDASNLTLPVYETSAEATLLDRVNEWDKIIAHEAGEGKVMDKKSYDRNIKQADEVTSKHEDLTKRLNDLNRQWQKNELHNLSGDNQVKTCYSEKIRRSKAKFREEIISHINELKGYVQGTIDPLLLAKDIQFRYTEMNDENRRQIAMIIKEYANSMLQKLDNVIDEFVYSVCEAGEVLNDKEYKVKNALESLGVGETDLSTAPLKIEMNQYYNALEKATRSKSQIPSYLNVPRSRYALRTSARPLESVSTHTFQDFVWSKTSEAPSRMMPKSKIPAGVNIAFKPHGVNKPDHPAVEKLKSSHSKPTSKLVLNQQQMKFLNILKSELEDNLVL